MSLRLKFGALLGLLACAVLLPVGFTLWTFDRFQAHVRDPLHGMTVVLRALGEGKRSIEDAALASGVSVGTGIRAPGLRAPRPVSAEDIQRFDRQLDQALAVLGGPRADPTNDERARWLDEWRMRTGSTSQRNLEDRIRAARTDGHAYFDLQAASSGAQPPVAALEDARENVGRALSAVHEVIERMEAHNVAEIDRTSAFSDQLRRRLFTVLGSTVLVALATSILGMVLIRRWILAPVADLRAATSRIAAGDLGYRIRTPATARPDELQLLSAEVNHMAGMVKTMQDERVERERLAALGEMVRRLVHNLRNPLAGIRGLAELTRSDLDTLGPAAADLKENQDRIITSVDRFERWLNDLLSATRPMTLQPEPTAIPRWLHGLVEAHRPMAQTRGVDLQVTTDPDINQAVFDPRHLEHAVSALLSNALEAASSPASKAAHSSRRSVHVRTLSAHHSGSDREWAICVEDTGPGIPPSLREDVFKPYFTTKRDGNGIGLAVALQVVKAHGGRIDLESPLQDRQNPSGDAAGAAGTRFTIWLPTDRPALANNGESGSATASQHMAPLGPSGASGGQNPRH